ncbi:MAG TPA: FAD binding domain-containing protein [Acidimicrobiales bacterium]
MNVTIATSARDITADAEILAGGTDLSERLRSGVTTGPVVDISGLPGLDSIGGAGTGPTTLGALVTVAALGANDRIRRDYPALAAPARTLATPQIRAMATLGGALCQHTRCWYYRHPDLRCFKTGGDSCPARDGNHRFGVAFDLGPCVHPHPSSIALGLLAYDATFSTTTRQDVPIGELWGDGSDPTRDHGLAAGEMLTRVTLPAATPSERSAYVRLVSRAWAEWPLVECVARLVLPHHLIEQARVCVGGVANIPLRLVSIEQELIGRPPTSSTLTAAADRAIDGASPLEQTRYKLPMIVATVQDALERALAFG